MKKRVAIPFYEHPQLFTPEARKLLTDSGFEIVSHDTGKPISKQELIALVKDAYASVVGVEVYSKEVLEVAPKLRVLTRFGVGMDNIDLNFCRERGIRVARSVNFNAVAETTISLILASMKNTAWYDRSVRNGNWSRRTSYELRGKNVSLIGFGRIGKRVAELLSGFGVHILAYDPYMDEEEAKRLHVCPVSMETALSEGDVISLHLPHTPQTSHLIDASAFAKMKDGVFFINTARGAIVDEDALCEALQKGKIRAAGLDVYAKEPLEADHPLRKMENVVLLPHIAAASYEGNRNTALICARSIIAVSEGREPEYPVV